MAKLPDTIEVSVREVPEVRAALAVFLDLLQQVDAFIAEQGEADFYTAPARAMRALLEGKTPAEDLQRGLDKFLAERGIDGVKASAPVEDSLVRLLRMAEDTLCNEALPTARVQRVIGLINGALAKRAADGVLGVDGQSKGEHTP